MALRRRPKRSRPPRYVLVCPDERRWQLPAFAPGPATAARNGPSAGRPPVFVLAVPPHRRRHAVEAVRRRQPEATVIVLADAPAPAPRGQAVTVRVSELIERVLAPALQQALTRRRVEAVRHHFRGAERVLIMMQDDPDPDAIASALALRALLGRTSRSATLATFGSIARAENRAMARVLDIDVERIDAAALGAYDRIALVDAQPAFLDEPFPRVDLVIDHHPPSDAVAAALVDVRPGYGATSTILTEYLRAAGLKLGERLATALLYGITADTLHLERGATPADLDAFGFLHPLANLSALRRIDRPAVPDAALDALAAGIGRRRTVDGALFTHLGAVPYPELVAQFADVFLQTEGVEWAVVSGTAAGELHVSVRNVGYVRAAGEVVREAFGDLGRAGGHRTMAKAVVRLDDWRRCVGEPTDDTLAAAVATRFVTALGARRGRPVQ